MSLLQNLGTCEDVPTISPPPTAAVREKSGGAAETITREQNDSRSERLCHGLAEDTGAKKQGTRTNESGGGEKLYKIKRIAKTQRFIEKMKALRADPRNCKRCGKPRDCERRQCRSCIQKAAKRRLLLTYKEVHKNPELLTAIIKRVESLENTVARHGLVIRKVRKAAWQKGYARGRKAEFFLWRDRQVELPTITKQELATMNHAYDNREMA